MPRFGGIVDSYAYYVPTDDRAEAPAVPSFDRVPTDGTEWCGVDERTYDGPVWSPSVCTSDGGIDAKDENDAINILLERHSFTWPKTIDAWSLSSTRREVVLDDRD